MIKIPFRYSFQIQFTQRVQRVVESFENSWVYVDAGNAMYLQWQVNLDHIVTVMKQMPQSIRGFSINVGSFVNSSFNEQLASEIHCQTGLHFVIDTSRNGGDFSSRYTGINRPPTLYCFKFVTSITQLAAKGDFWTATNGILPR